MLMCRRRVWRAIFAQLAFVHNHGALVLLRHTLQPTWSGSTFEQAPASAPASSKLLARIVSCLNLIRSWYGDAGKKLFATLCTIVMVLYVLFAFALGVALLVYTFSL
jgi:hypothetical protein